MYAANAVGAIMPPYVVYKAEHLWDTWTVGGPKGTRYNRSKSGWFDMTHFQDWFFTFLLPSCKKFSGPKSSEITFQVIFPQMLSKHVKIKTSDLSLCHQTAFTFANLWMWLIMGRWRDIGGIFWSNGRRQTAVKLGLSRRRYFFNYSEWAYLKATGGRFWKRNKLFCRMWDISHC